jgi:hypothetical protein
MKQFLCARAFEGVPERRRQASRHPILTTNEHFKEKSKLTLSQYWGTEGQEKEIQPAGQ